MALHCCTVSQSSHITCTGNTLLFHASQTWQSYTPLHYYCCLHSLFQDSNIHTTMHCFLSFFWFKKVIFSKTFLFIAAIRLFFSHFVLIWQSSDNATFLFTLLKTVALPLFLSFAFIRSLSLLLLLLLAFNFIDCQISPSGTFSLSFLNVLDTILTHGLYCLVQAGVS